MSSLSYGFRPFRWFPFMVLLAIGLQPGTAALADSETDFRDAVVATCKYLWGYSNARLSCGNPTITGKLNYSESCNISTECSVGTIATSTFQVSGTFEQHDFDDLYLCGQQLQVGSCGIANPTEGLQF